MRARQAQDPCIELCQKAAYNDGTNNAVPGHVDLAGSKFEEAGPPEVPPRDQEHQDKGCGAAALAGAQDLREPRIDRSDAQPFDLEISWR